MTRHRYGRLDESQLRRFRAALQPGFDEASRALSEWVQRPAVVRVEAVDQMDIDRATGLLGDEGEPVCFCVTETRGFFAGKMILAFDPESGFRLAEVLLGRSKGTIQRWDELERSALKETTNILCCAFLNTFGRSRSFTRPPHESLPEPPRFGQDFAESVLEFAIMDQAAAGDQAVVCKTRFEIDALPIECNLMWIPDAASLQRSIQSILTDPNEG